MVKFGEQIVRLRLAKWEKHYLDYNRLKSFIKTPEGRQKFREQLNSELDMVDTFCEDKQAYLCIRFQDVFSHANTEGGEHMGAVYDFLSELEELRGFIVVNAIAVIKIVKKYNKNCAKDQESQLPQVDVEALLSNQKFYRAETFANILHNTHKAVEALEPPHKHSQHKLSIKQRLTSHPALALSKAKAKTKDLNDDDDSETEMTNLTSILPRTTFDNVLSKLDEPAPEYLHRKLAHHSSLFRIAENPVVFPLDQTQQAKSAPTPLTTTPTRLFFFLLLLLSLSLVPQILFTPENQTQTQTQPPITYATNPSTLLHTVATLSLPLTDIPLALLTPHLLLSFPFPRLPLTLLNPHLTQNSLSSLDPTCDTPTPYRACIDRPGIGSGLSFDRFHGTKRFFANTDRGPNQDCDELAHLNSGESRGMYPNAAGKGGKSFMVPDFSPTLLSFVATSQIESIEVIPLKKRDGSPTTGVSNVLGRDDSPWPTNCDGSMLPFDLSGVDIEEVEPLPNGNFLLVEEYAPSVLVVDSAARILVRYVPVNEYERYRNVDVGYRVVPLLPTILSQRRHNRGFEAVSVNNEGTKAYATLQSPVGDKAKSRVIRTVVLDISDPLNAVYEAMFVSIASDADIYPKKPKQTAVKVSASSFVADNKILLLERASGPGVFFYLADFTQATNIKGKFDGDKGDEIDSPDIDLVADYNVVPAKMSLVVSSEQLAEPSREFYEPKQEGLAVLAPHLIATITDNDFGLGGKEGSRLNFLFIPSPLPMPPNNPTTTLFLTTLDTTATTATKTTHSRMAVSRPTFAGFCVGLAVVVSTAGVVWARKMWAADPASLWAHLP